MAEMEQKLSDLMSLSAASAEVVNENNTRMEGMDKNMTLVGQSVVATYQVANVSAQNTEEVKKALTGIMGQQQNIVQGLDDLITSIRSGVRTFDDSQGVLDNLMANLNNADSQTKNQLQDVINAVNGTSIKFGEDIDRLANKLIETDQHVSSVSNETEIKTLQDDLSTAKEMLTSLSEVYQQNKADDTQRINDLTQAFVNAGSQMEAISRNTAAINDKMDSAIARIGTMTLKVNALTTHE